MVFIDDWYCEETDSWYNNNEFFDFYDWRDSQYCLEFTFPHRKLDGIRSRTQISGAFETAIMAETLAQIGCTVKYFHRTGPVYGDPSTSWKEIPPEVFEDLREQEEEDWRDLQRTVKLKLDRGIWKKEDEIWSLFQQPPKR